MYSIYNRQGRLCYTIPLGMMKESLSAVSPHSARYSWKIVTQVMIMATHIDVPIIDRMTSVKEIGK